MSDYDPTPWLNGMAPRSPRDIVSVLRSWAKCRATSKAEQAMLFDAADEIERLRATAREQEAA